MLDFLYILFFSLYVFNILSFFQFLLYMSRNTDIFYKYDNSLDSAFVSSPLFTEKTPTPIAYGVSEADINNKLANIHKIILDSDFLPSVSPIKPNSQSNSHSQTGSGFMISSPSITTQVSSPSSIKVSSSNAITETNILPVNDITTDAFYDVNPETVISNTSDSSPIAVKLRPSRTISVSTGGAKKKKSRKSRKSRKSKMSKKSKMSRRRGSKKRNSKSKKNNKKKSRK